jgi:Cof subfamily protein (haloacid dehalogenase superfamily)
MEKKLVFFDIDGTLLDHDKKLPANTKKAIQLLKEQGTEVAIATGRAPFMFEDLRKELGITSFVSFNGQYVVYEGDVIYKNPLNKDVLKELKEYSHTKKHPIVFMDEHEMKASVKNHPYILGSMKSLKFKHPDFNPSYHEEKEILQALLFCKSEDESFYIENYQDFTFIRWHEFSTDILPSGGSKAEGIKKMLDIIGFEKEQVYAFGDGLNDLEMLEYVGTGIAMGNAGEELKKIADIVTKPVDEDGVLYGLELVGLL